MTCIWDDCDQDAIYCEGHAHEYMQPDIELAIAEKRAAEIMCEGMVTLRKQAEARLAEAERLLQTAPLTDRAQHAAWLAEYSRFSEASSYARAADSAPVVRYVQPEIDPETGQRSCPTCGAYWVG